MQLYLSQDLLKSGKDVRTSKRPKDQSSSRLLLFIKGELFGKPVHTRDPDKCVGEEISHLVKDKDYEQKRAIAAAYNICKHPARKNKSIDLVLEC